MFFRCKFSLETILFAVVFLGIFSLAGYVFFSNLERPLSRADEVMYVRRVQGMIAHGSPLASYIGDTPSLNKPPLAQWIASLSVMLLGESATSHRLPSAVAGALVFCLVIYLTLRWSRSLAAAAVAGLALLSCAVFTDTNGTRSAGVEAILSLCTVSVMALIYEVSERCLVQERPGTNRKISLLAGALFSLGILTKSVAICITVVIATLYISFRAYQLSLTPRVAVSRLRPSILCFVLAALPIPLIYYTLLIINYPEAPSVVFSQEIAQRFGKGYHHAKDPFFYLGLIVVGRRVFAPELLLLTIVYSSWRCYRAVDPIRLLLLLWALVPLLLFSFLPSRLPWYIFPSVPPLAILIGMTVAEISQVLPQRGTIPSKALACGALAVMVLSLCTPFHRVLARVRHNETLPIAHVIEALRKHHNFGLESYITSDLELDRQEEPYIHFIDSKRVTSDEACHIAHSAQQDIPKAVFISLGALQSCAGFSSWFSYAVLPPFKARKQEIRVLVLGSGRLEEIMPE